MNSFEYGFFDELEKMGGFGDTLREYMIAARRSAKPTLRDMRSTVGLASIPAALTGLHHAVPDSPFAYNVAGAVTAVPAAAKAYQDMTSNFSDKLKRLRELRSAMKKTAADRGAILGDKTVTFWERTPDGKIKYEKPVPSDASHPRIKREHREILEHRLSKSSPISRKKALIAGALGGAAFGVPMAIALSGHKHSGVLAPLLLGATTLSGAFVGNTAHETSKRDHEELEEELGKLKKTAAKGVATKTNPGLWARAKAQAKAKMGGKHSARAMQLATQIYKKGGGGYSGRKPSASSNKMVKWTKQKWRTRPGTNPIAKKESGRTSRYLPEKKWKNLSKGEQVATDKKKLSSSNQFVSNTPAARVKSKHKYT